LTNSLIIPANWRLVERLWEFEEVVAIQLDSQVICSIPPVDVSFPSSARRTGDYAWGLEKLGIHGLHRRGSAGYQITIGMADTGVCEGHAALKGKVPDFAVVEPPGRLVPAHSFDFVGHGTHCAGILVGNSSSGIQIGGAPGAELKVVSCLHCREEGWVSDLLAAVEWLGDPYRSVDVLNLSIGCYADRVPKDELKLLGRALERLSRYVVLVAAIGNEPGRSAYPGKFDFVLSAGAIDENGQVADFSGDEPDLVLPGVDVYSCVPAGRETFSGKSYAEESGTSVAAAHLSAVAALVLEACPDSGPSDVAAALKRTARGVGGGYDVRFGHGIPDAGETIAALR
jgi:subtilisin family serine protease